MMCVFLREFCNLISSRPGRFVLCPPDSQWGEIWLLPLNLKRKTQLNKNPVKSN